MPIPRRRRHELVPIDHPPRRHLGLWLLAIIAIIAIIATLAILIGRGPVLGTNRPSSTQEALLGPSSRVDVYGAARVIDGDTLVIEGVRIRLFGIDAPETRQSCMRNGRPWPCGEASTAALVELIGSSPVHCAPTGKDIYSRTLAQCRVGSVDIQSWMVERGWAVAYSRYSSLYEPEQARSQSLGVGIWQGSVTPPEEWRRRR